MKTAVIRSSWMEGYGYRLDSSPYLGGALETKVLLEKLTLRKDKLHTLTKGFDGGIYNGPTFSRTYVESPEFGVPFVGSGSMLYADLSNLPLLSRRQAEGRMLRHLELKPGMSLISCSGTIGRMIYTRRDMAGMWSSQHILKVVADPEKIPSGCLYAYLSGKFGIPLIVSGTYGSIIHSIGPKHVADLPVPRLGDALEHEIHTLVEQAAELRTKASQEFHAAVADFEQTARLLSSSQLCLRKPGQHVVAQNSRLQGRMDTNFHRAYHYDALAPFLTGTVKNNPLSRFARSIVEPIRFKRLEHDNAEHAIPFFGTGSLGDVDPEPLYSISRSPSIEDYRVDETQILIPRSGQIYGIIGTAFQPIGRC